MRLSGFVIKDKVEAVPKVSKVPGVPHVIDVPIVQPLRSSPNRAVPIVPVVPSLRSVQVGTLMRARSTVETFNSSRTEGGLPPFENAPNVDR